MIGIDIYSDGPEFGQIVTGFAALNDFMRQADMEFAGAGVRDRARWEPRPGMEVRLLPKEGVARIVADVLTNPYDMHVNRLRITEREPMRIASIAVAVAASPRNRGASLIARSETWGGGGTHFPLYAILDLVEHAGSFKFESSKAE